uniref:ZCN14 n=1 Tax=Arundo donax TaxID=35708 RepID=A0A0A9BUH2_ARUDO
MHIIPPHIMSSSHSSPTSSRLPLAVEVDGGDRRAEVVQLGKVAAAEVLSPPRGVDCLPA